MDVDPKERDKRYEHGPGQGTSSVLHQRPWVGKRRPPYGKETSTRCGRCYHVGRASTNKPCFTSGATSPTSLSTVKTKPVVKVWIRQGQQQPSGAVREGGQREDEEQKKS